MPGEMEGEGVDQSAHDAASIRGEKPGIPQEKPQEVWTRRLILLSFWAVVVCFGLPHWIWTTSIHRSDLPLERMREWDAGKTCQFRYPLTVRLDAWSSFDDHSRTILVNDIQQRLDTLSTSASHLFEVTYARYDPVEEVDIAKDWALTVLLTESHQPSGIYAQLEPLKPLLKVGLNAEQPLDAVASFISGKIHAIFEDEQRSTSYLLSKSPFANGTATGLSVAETDVLDSRTTRAFKYASTYHLTFSLFTNSASPSAWEIETALRNSIAPLLEPCSRISKFTIDTQVQLHASLSPSIAGPTYDEASKEWRLTTSDLSGFINAAEWPLSPSIGAGPTINFVLYIPSAEQSPLVIGQTGGNSWLVPQWGAVQILNLASSATPQQTLTAADLEPVMLTFADQLSSLLGLAPEPSSLSLRISRLTRERATSLIMSASSTLGALARLTLKLKSIAIPSSVSTSVFSTLHHLELACEDLRSGRYDDALAHARVAEEEAEQAFFEPSMVGQVYFPDEHKVAVYVPLLGPMAVPLIMAALKELKALRDRRKVKTA
nr:GPI transamidase component PIG-S homolog [Quercus suber]POF15558.1 gpi transamidase component pig-s like [Quercus suber]